MRSRPRSNDADPLWRNFDFCRFAFKHVLLRDAIYGFLLRSKRQPIHGDVAAIFRMTFRSSQKINPKSWPITTKKRAITSWNPPLVQSGHTPSRMPPMAKRLPIFEALQLRTLCRNARADQTRDRHSTGVGNTAYRRSRVCLRGNLRSVFAGSYLMPANRQRPRIFPSPVWIMGILLDGWKEL